MKICILTQDAPLYLGDFLDRLCRRLITEGDSIEGVLVLSPIFKKTLLEEVKARFSLYGMRDFVLMCLHIMSVKIISLFSTGCYSVAVALKKYGICRLNMPDVNSDEFRAYLQAEHIDLVISIACPKIISEETLATPRFGSINYHTGKLPEYRGRQPMFWALLNREKDVTITVHEMRGKLDAGPIVVEEVVPLDSDETLHSLYKKTVARGPEVVCQAVKKIGAGDTSRRENDVRDTQCYSFPSKKDGAEFRARGYRYY